MTRNSVKRFTCVDAHIGLDDPETIKAVDFDAKAVVKKHGKHIYLRFDAGYNNISVEAVRPLRRGR